MLVLIISIITVYADGIVVVKPDYHITLTAESALEYAKRAFEGDWTSRDFYLMADNDTANWLFFVDGAPDSGWEHPCHIATVPKQGDRRFLFASLTEASLPPSDSMTMVFSHMQLRFNTKQKPTVAQRALSEQERETANRTYAIILNGGINKNANHERCWNDCSFIYQTLVKGFGVPKTNISVVMGDGTDPSVDMRHYGNYGDGEYVSSPLDLDSDGIPDIQYAATLDNLRAIFSQLEGRMGVDDHLLFFVIGGGSTLNDSNQTSFINLWGEEKLSSFTLSEMLKPLLVKKITFNAVFGQSYGGGLANDVAGSGCVVVSATDAAHWPTPATNKPYSQFLYQWTSAINKANSWGYAVESDLNNDGYVTMDEAFQYAKGNDTIPQYNSNPAYLGRELSFGDLAETTNLYIKDNYGDTGAEPNVSTGRYWDSPSIWVRNLDDGIEKHETVSYMGSGTKAYVYVKIHNRGKEVIGGTGRYLDVYWAFASTAVGNKTWLGQETYTGYKTGGYVGRTDIGAIEPGDSAVVKVEWKLPANPYINTGNLQFCIGVKMDGKTLPVSGPLTINNQPPLINPLGSRCDAIKSVSVVASKNIKTGEVALVRNISLLSKTYSLTLLPRTQRDIALLSSANVELVPDVTLYEAWKRGGRQKIGVQETSSTIGNPSVFRVKDANNSLKGIAYEGGEIGRMALRVRLSLSGDYPNYAFDLIQRDSDNNIVGATTFISQAASAAAAPAMETAALSIEDEQGIETLTPAASVGDVLAVGLKSPAPENAALTVTSVLDGTTGTTTSLQATDETAEIFVGNLKPGVYAVTYTIDGMAVDTAKFTKR